MTRSLLSVPAILFGFACGPADDPFRGIDATVVPGDSDGDGYSGADDCNEADPLINIAASEQCNQFDDNCNDQVDEGYDNDSDGYSQCLGDCNDLDAAVHPGAVDLCDDGNDSDCNPLTSSDFDSDGDGWTICDGDCDDGEALVNPMGVEVQVRVLKDGTEEPELVDNDCDGLVDEPFEPCDGALPGTVPLDFVKALDVCGPWITNATWNNGLTPPDPRAHAIATDFGVSYVPHMGSAFTVHSSGVAADANPPGYEIPQGGTGFVNTAPHPAPLPSPGDGCGSADPAVVNDFVELDVEMVVPPNALSFSFDFNFMSAEFNDYVCSSFDDTFVAFLESSAFTGNISFDALGHPVSVNIGFFNVCDTVMGPSCADGADLIGTGYEVPVFTSLGFLPAGGGTGWLTTTAPVVPGETIHLRFSVFDEGDHSLDSAVLLDNFRWEAVAVEAPTTIPRLVP